MLYVYCTSLFPKCLPVAAPTYVCVSCLWRFVLFCLCGSLWVQTNSGDWIFIWGLSFLSAVHQRLLFVSLPPPIIHHLEFFHIITHAVVSVYETKSLLCSYSVAICIVYRTEEKVNHVLLFTVLNPVYPITVVSMSTILSFTLITSSVSCSILYMFITIHVNGCCVHNMLPSWFRKSSLSFSVRIKIFRPYVTLFSTSIKLT